jgi:hypothetical protein
MNLNFHVPFNDRYREEEERFTCNASVSVGNEIDVTPYGSLLILLIKGFSNSLCPNPMGGVA